MTTPQRDREANPLGSLPIPRLLARYAVPSVISMLVMSVYNIVDQIFIGWGIGYLGNGATTVAFPIVTVMTGIALLLGNGAAAGISLELGKGNREGAQRILGSAFTLVVVAGILVTALGLWQLEPILRAMGTTDNIMPYAQEYTGIILVGAVFAMMGTGLSNTIRADGSPGFSMVATLSGAVLNIILDPLFIFTFDMGVAGAALATVISQILTAALVLYYFLRRSKLARLSLKTLVPNPAYSRRLCALGSASFVTQMAITIINIILNNSMKHYGGLSAYGSDITIPAMGVVIKINTILINLVLGVAVGAQPILGFNYGAGNYRRVKRTFQTEVAITSAISTTICILFVLFPHLFISIFRDENQLFNDFAALFMRVYLSAIFIIGVQIPSSNYFQATGKPWMAMILSMSRQLLILAPLILILPRFFGLMGILYAGPVADVLSCLLTGAFIIREMGKLGRMEQAQEEAAG